MNENFKVSETPQNDSESVCIVIRSVPAKFGPSTMSGRGLRPKVDTKSRILRGHIWDKCIHPLRPLPEIVEGPNFAGTLLITIQTDYESFWGVSETLKFSFIFVHSVHSRNQEHSRTFLEAQWCRT